MEKEAKRLADKWLTQDDYASSTTALMVGQFMSAIRMLKHKNIKNIADLGCGFGGITLLVSDYLSAESAVGLDINDMHIQKARDRGLTVIKSDIYNDKLPLEDDSCDLVLCNGVLTHMPFFDNAIIKSYQLLRDNGYVVYTIRNAANYLDRIALLLGYQPNDALICPTTFSRCLIFIAQKGNGDVK